MIGLIRHNKSLSICLAVAFFSMHFLVLLHYLVVDHHADHLREGVEFTRESDELCELHDFFRYFLSEEFLPDNTKNDLNYSDFIQPGERLVWCEPYAVSNICGRAPPECFLPQNLKQIRLI